MKLQISPLTWSLSAAFTILFLKHPKPQILKIADCLNLMSPVSSIPKVWLNLCCARETSFSKKFTGMSSPPFLKIIPPIFKAAFFAE
jgi:hypothetical protein